jgi:hypothetical protein
MGYDAFYPEPFAVSFTDMDPRAGRNHKEGFMWHALLFV